MGLAAALGCGGSGTDTPPPPPPAAVLAAATPSGDGQIGLPTATLAAPLRVQITSSGAPIAGRMVGWTVQNGGAVDPTQSTTGADGVAATVVTLGSQPIMIISATATGASGSPVRLTALAATAAATVQVVNNRFDPPVIAIRAGGIVSFAWPAGSSQHNLVPDDGRDRPNDPIVHDGPLTVDVTFPTAGDFYYHCGVHGDTRSGMFGKVVVVP